MSEIWVDFPCKQSPSGHSRYRGRLSSETSLSMTSKLSRSIVRDIRCIGINLLVYASSCDRLEIYVLQDLADSSHSVSSRHFVILCRLPVIAALPISEADGVSQFTMITFWTLSNILFVSSLVTRCDIAQLNAPDYTMTANSQAPWKSDHDITISCFLTTCTGTSGKQYSYCGFSESSTLIGGDTVSFFTDLEDDGTGYCRFAYVYDDPTKDNIASFCSKR